MQECFHWAPRLEQGCPKRFAEHPILLFIYTVHFAYYEKLPLHAQLALLKRPMTWSSVRLLAEKNSVESRKLCSAFDTLPIFANRNSGRPVRLRTLTLLVFAFNPILSDHDSVREQVDVIRVTEVKTTSPITKRNHDGDRMQLWWAPFWNPNSSGILSQRSTWYFTFDFSC